MKTGPNGEYTILLRSSWQTVNIGDIAHTPGMLTILERYLPEASVILWAGRLDRGVEPILRRRFPNVRIVRGGAKRDDVDPSPDDPTLDEAIAEADLLLHGSSATAGALVKLHEIHQQTGKPYGAYGVTIGSPIGTDSKTVVPQDLIESLRAAAFIYTRETKSLKVIRELDLPGRTDFVPDATFALDLHDDDAARKLLQQHDLEPEKFICAVPRLRFSPYWDIYPDRTFKPGEVAEKKAVNETHAEADHAKMREAIAAWVRKTGLKVLICPEMTYQVDIIRPLVYDPLPEVVKPFVVPLDRYWLTDEAASVYQRARAVISMECHSPIMANANGRPAFYLRQPTDTWKGQMYPDLGLGDWKFEIETCTGHEIAEGLLKVHQEYDKALDLARRAAAEASSRFESSMNEIRNLLAATKKTGGAAG